MSLWVSLVCETCTDRYGRPTDLGTIDGLTPLDEWPQCPTCGCAGRWVADWNQTLPIPEGGCGVQAAWQLCLIVSVLGSVDVFEAWHQQTHQYLDRADLMRKLEEYGNELIVGRYSSAHEWAEEWALSRLGCACGCVDSLHGLSMYLDWESIAEDALNSREHTVITDPNTGELVVINDLY